MVDLLNQRFSRLIGGMSLARKNDLHRAFWIVQDTPQTSEVSQDERRSFIGGEAPGKANRQGIGIEDMLELIDLTWRFALSKMLAFQTLARVIDEQFFPPP